MENNENNNISEDIKMRIGYPVYSDGKLLTSDDLNRSFNYLHSHIKFTRKLLFGQGIVSGLSYSYNKDTGIITIQPGIAITSQGSIIELTEKIICDRYEELQEKNEGDKSEENNKNKIYKNIKYVLIKKKQGSEKTKQEEEIKEIEEIEEKVVEVEDSTEQIEEETDNTIKYLDSKLKKEKAIKEEKGEETEVFNDFFVGLLLNYKEIKENYCSGDSCTTKADEKELEIIPFLTSKNFVRKSDNHAVINENIIFPIQAPVFKNIVNYNILPIFLRKVTNHFYEKIDVITEALEKINNIKFNELLITYDSKETSKYELGGEEGVIEKVKKLNFDNQNIPAYLSFTDDLIDAINEFINFYTLFLSKYRISETLLLDEAVILGKLGDITELRETLNDVYQDFGKINDEKILIRLFKRIKLMVECFKNFIKSDFKPNEMLELLPISNKHKLGEKAIPFYYISYENEYNSSQKPIKSQSTQELIIHWDAHNAQHIESETNAFLLYFKKADLYKLNGYNNINIEKDLTDKIYLDNLPLLVVKQEMAGYDLSFFLEDYKIEDSETINNDVINETLNLIFESENIKKENIVLAPEIIGRNYRIKSINLQR